MSTKIPFSQVIEAHGATVLRVCRAILGSHDADDAWSETFLAALRAYPELDPEANLESWLVTIAHRKSLDLVRSESRRIRATSRFGADISHNSTAIHTTTPPDSYYDAQELILQLPLKQRQAIAYHYLGGMPYTKVAELTGGTAEAARRAAADGIAALRIKFGTTKARRTSK